MATSRRGLRAVSAPAVSTPVRAAIYTRKSTDENLDSDFSSLDNQRERAEAFIASQGWTPITARYDDGGFSGGNTDRPALRRLRGDVEAGLVDTVVVYRLDRLTRSLLDFLNLHRFLEKHSVQIVSVTEPIDTRTPMGRAFVNILVSFGQMEREVAGERTAHKIQAARRHGKFTGGHPPLGYDLAPEGGELLVNKDEAATVVAIFELYVEMRSLVKIADELNRRGWRRKTWITRAGKQSGGGEWNRVSLARLLKDPVCVGKQKLGDEVFPGEHNAIVPKALFNRVQKLLAGNRSTGGATTRNKHGALLRGLIHCAACDRAMTHAPTRVRGRLHRYYRCVGAQKNGHDSCPTKSVKADVIETFVVDQIRRIGADVELQEETFRQAVAQVAAQRRGLQAERKRLDRDRTATQADVARLVATLGRTTGPAADAVAAELEKAQEHLATAERRLGEIQAEVAALKAQEIDRDELARALTEFDPIWEVLLTPERERVLQLLIERIDYRGDTGDMKIAWRLSGFGQLAAEVTP